MGEIRTVTTLRTKRDSIAAAIENYEKRLSQARADLAHVSAVIALFEASGERDAIAPYVDTHRLYRRGEAMMLCKEAMAANGPMTTRELALAVMKAKGLEQGDKVLAKAIAARLIHALRQQCRRGIISGDGKRGNVRIWSLRA